MSSTPTKTAKTPNRARLVASFTLPPQSLRKLARLDRKWKARNRSASMERMINEAHALEFGQEVAA